MLPAITQLPDPLACLMRLKVRPCSYTGDYNSSTAALLSSVCVITSFCHFRLSLVAARSALPRRRCTKLSTKLHSYVVHFSAGVDIHFYFSSFSVTNFLGLKHHETSLTKTDHPFRIFYIPVVRPAPWSFYFLIIFCVWPLYAQQEQR